VVAKTKQFFSFVIPGLVKPIRVLWNEMIGFVFLCLGLLPLPSAYRAWQEWGTVDGAGVRFLMTASFSVVMLYFGITSFLRARTINRS
jgi:hypothetical protein